MQGNQRFRIRMNLEAIQGICISWILGFGLSFLDKLVRFVILNVVEFFLCCDDYYDISHSCFLFQQSLGFVGTLQWQRMILSSQDLEIILMGVG